MDTYRNFIGGKWIQSNSAKTVHNVNPANMDDVIGTVRQATRVSRPPRAPERQEGPMPSTVPENPEPGWSIRG